MVFGPKELVVRPSARNRRAIAAYEKAGFSPVSPGEEEGYGPGEYADTVTMVKRP